LKITAIGEFGFINRINRFLKKRLPPGAAGIGDDCAVIPLTGSKCLLVTTDMLVEGTHFMLPKIKAHDLGHKSLAVNLSDIAAMGGRPEWAFVSLAIPPQTSVEFLDGFYKGMKAIADKYEVGIVGGDTTRSGFGLVINIAVTGSAFKNRIKYRSNAMEGDVIVLTNYVGDSNAGLSTLLNDLALDRDARYLIRKHNRPEPELSEGSWLAARRAVRSMMDVSDGLDSDIRRIMESSGSGAEIYLEKLPVSPPLLRKAKGLCADPLETAAKGGEDYCLLATVDPQLIKRLAADFRREFGRPLYSVGRITGKSSGLRYFKNGQRMKLEGRGFEHFKPD